MLFPNNQKLRTAGQTDDNADSTSVEFSKRRSAKCKNYQNSRTEKILWVLVPRMIGNAGSTYIYGIWQWARAVGRLPRRPTITSWDQKTKPICTNRPLNQYQEAAYVFATKFGQFRIWIFPIARTEDMELRIMPRQSSQVPVQVDCIWLAWLEIKLKRRPERNKVPVFRRHILTLFMIWRGWKLEVYFTPHCVKITHRHPFSCISCISQRITSPNSQAP